LDRADSMAVSSLPSGAPRPDDASKAQFVMAGLLARESKPAAAFPRILKNSQWHRRGLVAYSCGGSAGLKPASLFTFHAEGPSQKTLSPGCDGVNRNGWAAVRNQLTSPAVLRQLGREKEPDVRQFPVSVATTRH
jgi:hypothetical protein